MATWKTMAVLTLFSLLTWGPSCALAEGPEQIELQAPLMGTVSFPHAVHQTREESCETCHHKGVERGSCSGCHEISKSSPQGRDFFHQVCRNCHQEKGGPVQCAGCHTRPSG